MANMNYLRSVSPLFNVASAISSGEQILGGLAGSGAGRRDKQGPLGGTNADEIGAGGGGMGGKSILDTAPQGAGDTPASGGQSDAAPLAGGPTQYRPPTRVAEENIFGQRTGWRDTTPQERSEYNVRHLSDRRNQGYGAGQVDPGLARAAIRQEKENSGGGNKGGK